ncbi:MAG: hypothetical protein ACYDHY_19495 [Acidiferrobacterales bacterium]
MGLDLVALNADCDDVRYPVGNYSFVHHLRAMLILLFVHTALQTIHSDSTDETLRSMLSWADLGKRQINQDDASATKKDIEWIFQDWPELRVDYAMIPDDPFMFSKMDRGTIMANAAVGLWKFVNHSDCDGHLSSGDAADIARFLDFVQRPPDMVAHDIVGHIVGLTKFFRECADSGTMIMFA